MNTLCKHMVFGAITVVLILNSAELFAKEGGAQEDTVIRVAYFPDGPVAQDAIVATSPELTKTVPAAIKWLGIHSGPAAMAGFKGNTYDMASGVGNAPLSVAIANGTDFKILWVNNTITSGLVVNNSIKTIQDMAGKTFGTPLGTSQDFQFRGFLKAHNLLGKVRLVPLEFQALAAAYATGAVAGGFNTEPQLSQMLKSGGHVLATAEDVNALGYPVLLMWSASGPFIAKHPDLVQAMICAVKKATDFVNGPERDNYFRRSSAITGQDPAEAAALGRREPFWTSQDQLTAKGLGKPGHIAEGAVANSLLMAAKWQKEQGNLSALPTTDAIVKHIDTSFAEHAIAGQCPK